MTTEQIITILGIVLGSGGLWTLVTKLIDKHTEKKMAVKESLNDLKSEMKLVANATMGVTYDRAKTLGESYIKRGWIHLNELEDYDKYLYEPYKKLGGDGTIDEIHKKLLSLPIDSLKKRSEV